MVLGMLSKFNNRGLAVITVLGVMLVLLVMGVTFVTISRVSRKLGQNHIALMHARNCAESGFQHALAMIYDDSMDTYKRVDSYSDRWASTFYDVNYSGTSGSRQNYDLKEHTLNNDPRQKYYVMVEDEAGKVNVNFCNYDVSGPAGVPGVDIDINQFGIDNSNWEAHYMYSHPWLYFPEEILLYNEGDTLPYLGMSRYLTARSYTWVKDKIVNLYDAWNVPYGMDPVALFNKIFIYFGDIAEQVAFNIKDFYDRDAYFSINQERTLCGMDAAIFINEVLTNTSDASTQEKPDWAAGTGAFIEVWNPYAQEALTQNWKIKWSGGEYCFMHNIPANSFFVITDDTGRYEDLFGRFPDAQVPFAEFNIQGITSFQLIYDDITYGAFEMDVFDIPAGSITTNETASVSKYDPRTLDPQDLQGAAPTPGEVNINFNVPDWLPEPGYPFVLNDGVHDFEVTALSFLKYVCFRGGTGGAKYLNIRAATVFDSNNNGLLDNPEAAHYLLLKEMYDFDNAVNDFYDDIDGILDTNPYTGLPESKHRISGKININTAPFEVLACLPGSAYVANAIIEHRKWLKDNTSYPFDRYNNIYDLIIAFKRAGFPEHEIDQRFENIVNLVTVESNIFTITSKGVYDGKYECSIVGVVDRNLEFNAASDRFDPQKVKVLYKFYREASA